MAVAAIERSGDADVDFFSRILGFQLSDTIQAG
jgi:hypothetical protein